MSGETLGAWIIGGMVLTQAILTFTALGIAFTTLIRSWRHERWDRRDIASRRTAVDYLPDREEYARMWASAQESAAEAAQFARETEAQKVRDLARPSRSKGTP